MKRIKHTPFKTLFINYLVIILKKLCMMYREDVGIKGRNTKMIIEREK